MADAGFAVLQKMSDNVIHANCCQHCDAVFKKLCLSCFVFVTSPGLGTLNIFPGQSRSVTFSEQYNELSFPGL
jgi:hypothetical protein